MVESYLIGNRLFKFLSIVLPTHNDYFSPDEKLSSLRMKSQNQLIELLEYMEELEVMIDEMEYNHHMMTATNLQRHQSLLKKQASGHITDETADTSRSMSEQDTSNESEKHDLLNPLPSMNALSSSGTRAPSNSTPVRCDDSFAILEDIGDDPSIAKHVNDSKRGGRTQSPQEFAQRVAAVVAASSNEDKDAPESASLTMRSISSANSFNKNRTSTNAIDSPVVKPPPISPRKSTVSIRKKERAKSPGSDFQSEASWGNSTFISDPFSCDFETQPANHIDLLADDADFDPFGVVPKERPRRTREPTQQDKIKLSLPALDQKKSEATTRKHNRRPRPLDAKLQNSAASANRRPSIEAATADSGMFSGLSSGVFLGRRKMDPK